MIVAMMVLAIPPSASAQLSAVNPEAYNAAVEDYASGRSLVEVVSALQPWGKKDFEEAVKRLILTRDLRQIEMAAIFQLEIGIGVVPSSLDGAEFHFDLGETLLKGLLLPPSERNLAHNQEVRALTASWRGVAASAYLSVTDTKRARPWIQKALQVAPRSAALKTMEGAMNEIDAVAFSPDRYLTLGQKSRAGIERSRRWTIAEECFRDAVEADPSYANGHIRLGRVQFLLGKIPQARQAIERGLASAKAPGEQYLAALFLGAVKEQQKDVAGARESYERALTIAPQSQTAMTALAYLDLIAGRPDRAQALARSFVSAPANDPWWWAYKNGGLDDEGLASIRARVKR